MIIPLSQEQHSTSRRTYKSININSGRLSVMTQIQKIIKQGPLKSYLYLWELNTLRGSISENLSLHAQASLKANLIGLLSSLAATTERATDTYLITKIAQNRGVQRRPKLLIKHKKTWGTPLKALASYINSNEMLQNKMSNQVHKNRLFWEQNYQIASCRIQVKSVKQSHAQTS